IRVRVHARFRADTPDRKIGVARQWSIEISECAIARKRRQWKLTVTAPATYGHIRRYIGRDSLETLEWLQSRLGVNRVGQNDEGTGWLLSEDRVVIGTPNILTCERDGMPWLEPEA